MGDEQKVKSLSQVFVEEESDEQLSFKDEPGIPEDRKPLFEDSVIRVSTGTQTESVLQISILSEQSLYIRPTVFPMQFQEYSESEQSSITSEEVLYINPAIEHLNRLQIETLLGVSVPPRILREKEWVPIKSEACAIARINNITCLPRAKRREMKIETMGIFIKSAVPKPIPALQVTFSLPIFVPGTRKLSPNLKMETLRIDDVLNEGKPSPDRLWRPFFRLVLSKSAVRSDDTGRSPQRYRGRSRLSSCGQEADSAWKRNFHLVEIVPTQISGLF